MSWDCRTITGIVTDYLATSEGSEQMRGMMARGASSEEITEALAAICDEHNAAVMRSEFQELPRNFVYTFLMAWGLATSDGKPFTLTSRPAPRPLEYAHQGRVSYEIVHEEAGVVMYVSHVHGQHAEWFKQSALTA